MSQIINLTQHPATPEQVEAGVVDVFDRETLCALLTFDTPPSQGEMERRAHHLVDLYWRRSDAAPEGPIYSAMIGGAPFFMSTLERVLLGSGITPLYAFSRRESVEQVLPGGEVKKSAVFRHAGFVEAMAPGA